MILSGEIRPGQRLSERELARRTEVSRTPLRAALARLQRDGLTVNKSGLGYFAVAFNAKVVGELFEFRELLEMHAARAAAQRISPAGIRQLKDIVRQLEVLERKKRPTPDELLSEVQLGYRIHEIIAEASGNDLLRASLLQIYDQLRLLTWMDLMWVDQWPLTRREHRALVEAVIKRDGKAAARVTQRHILRSKADALQVIETRHRHPFITSKPGVTNKPARSTRAH